MKRHYITPLTQIEEIRTECMLLTGSTPDPTLDKDGKDLGYHDVLGREDKSDYEYNIWDNAW